RAYPSVVSCLPYTTLFRSERAEAAAVIQDAVRSRGAGLGVLLSEEAPHGHQGLGSTLLPVNLAVAASWDVGALREAAQAVAAERSEEHTSELQSRFDLVCR